MRSYCPHLGAHTPFPGAGPRGRRSQPGVAPVNVNTITITYYYYLLTITIYYFYYLLTITIYLLLYRIQSPKKDETFILFYYLLI